MFRLVQIGSVQAFFTQTHHEAELREAQFRGDVDTALNADEADRDRRVDDGVDQAMWVAFGRFASDATVRAAAVGEPFVDASGALKSDLTESETEAMEAWASNEALDGGLFWKDVGYLAAGYAKVAPGS